MKEFDPVKEYLRDRGCPSHVVKAGLKGLVMTWEKVVAELVFDGYRFGLRDFVGDLDRREVLAGALDHLGERVPAAFRERVAVADKRFHDVTVPASRCLLPEADAEGRGLTRDTHAWYYRYPRRHRANFAKDLAEAGITAAPAA